MTIDRSVPDGTTAVASPAAPPGARLFTDSADRIVAFLAQRTPMQDWSVSRVSGSEQVHLHVSGPEAPLIALGQRVDWDDTFCRRMYAGAAQVVADSTLDPAYSDLPDVPAIRAYAGVPISDNDGELFGILCGVSSQPLPDPDAVDADLIRLFGQLLSAQMVASREQDRMFWLAGQSAAEAQTDALTGLLNRGGWDLATAEAHERCRSYGDQTAVAVIDLDGLKALNDTRGHTAGDEVLRRAAEALRSGVRSLDRAARYGGDEFAVLGHGVTLADLPAWRQRLVEVFAGAGVEASIGVAGMRPEDDHAGAAFERADAAMYADKVRRRERNG